MLNSLKTVTTRTEIYGQRGDQFEAFEVPFVILGVEKLPVRDVAFKWHKEEGFETMKGFVEIWNQIHPRLTYDMNPYRTVYLHKFIRRNLLLATTDWPGTPSPRK